MHTLFGEGIPLRPDAAAGGGGGTTWLNLADAAVPRWVYHPAVGVVTLYFFL